MAKAKEDEEKIEPAGFWQPTEEEDQIEGEVIDIVEGIYGSHYKIKTAKEEIMTPAHKVLLNRLQTVQKGQKVRIVYTGEQPPKVRGQNPTKMYEVYLKKKA